MKFTAAASWFVSFLLSVSVVQGQSDWRVTCGSTKICALKGSTVEIRCRYTYPSRRNGLYTEVQNKFWYTKLSRAEPVDLRTDSQYSGRVEYSYNNNDCTLRITDLRESDSAEYKFSFTTNQRDRSYTGSPGVTLTVTDLQVKEEHDSYSYSRRIYCHSVCYLPGRSSYIWYRNGEKIQGKTSYYYQNDYDYYYSSSHKYGDSYSCALSGHEDFPSPSVCVRGQTCNKVTYTHRNICAFKGSSVDISSTYSSSSYHVTSKFWFSPDRSHQWKNPSQPQDLREDSQYAGRVQVPETWTGSTLRITDLTESDSVQYRFKFSAGRFEWGSSLPGTTLTVKDPDLSVQVIWSSTGPKLNCQSSCITDRSSFVWYKNETKIWEETSPSYRGYVDPADTYSCAYKSYKSPPVYAPPVPQVSMSPHGDTMKDSSVSLTCSSDANPAAKYTWYKKNQTLRSREQKLVLNSVQPSDSGEYYCTAENELGKMTSKNVFVNVKYGPKSSNVSVSPSGDIVEGSSVKLTCSSDANPAATYTWYKGNQTLLQGPEGTYTFTSISSMDSGIYFCKSENQYSQMNSPSLSVEVQYPPKPPSVSVSPAGEIVEGSSVNLTCSSDANPAANYTWYKENEDSPKASGQNFTITDFRAEHSGNYYCEAQNKRGGHNSTLHLIAAAGARTSAAITTITAILLVIILLAVFLWIRRYKIFTQQSEGGERPNNRAQLNMGPVFYSTSAGAQKQPEEDYEDLHYASIHLCLNQEDALYSNIRPTQPCRQNEEEVDVEYSIVKTDNARSAPRTRHQEDGEDSFALYSTVNKSNVNGT
ncbi:sialoadhesin-like [Chaetodon auriga]|uniref:sialoadhesin-like n=1 Tax=Chaetodon auriga TaxID=39042 RepID=UPI004032B7C0